MVIKTKYRYSIVLSALLTALLVSISSCKEKKTPEPSPSPTFDKQALLVNLADNVIIPSYVAFNSVFKTLPAAIDSMIARGNQEWTDEVFARFNSSYAAYQRISPFGFGPGEEEAIRVNFNIFPCDTAKVMSNVRSGVYDLNQASNTTAKGFPAIDYLLFSFSPAMIRTDTRITNYIKALVNDMLQRSTRAQLKWQGEYRSVFINSLGTDVGSSVGFVINQLNFELDYLKNSKIANPLGLRSGGTPLPDNCEAYYSGHSVKYTLATLDAIESLYAGISASGSNGSGFDDYLAHLDIRKGTELLNNVINAQFNVARQSLKNLSDPLSNEVLNNKAQVQTAYNEHVKLLVLLKTDMPSSLGVVITYQDGDGD